MADFAVELESDVIRQARNITFASGGLGFQIIRFPPILCFGGDDDAVFYSTVLPVNILLVLGSTELVFIFYGLLKVSLQGSSPTVICFIWEGSAIVDISALFAWCL